MPGDANGSDFLCSWQYTSIYLFIHVSVVGVYLDVFIGPCQELDQKQHGEISYTHGAAKTTQMMMTMTTMTTRNNQYYFYGI